MRGNVAETNIYYIKYFHGFNFRELSSYIKLSLDRCKNNLIIPFSFLIFFFFKDEQFKIKDFPAIICNYSVPGYRHTRILLLLRDNSNGKIGKIHKTLSRSTYFLIILTYDAQLISTYNLISGQIRFMTMLWFPILGSNSFLSNFFFRLKKSAPL